MDSVQLSRFILLGLLACRCSRCMDYGWCSLSMSIAHRRMIASLVLFTVLVFVRLTFPVLLRSAAVTYQSCKAHLLARARNSVYGHP